MQRQLVGPARDGLHDDAPARRERARQSSLKQRRRANLRRESLDLADCVERKTLYHHTVDQCVCANRSDDFSGVRVRIIKVAFYFDVERPAASAEHFKDFGERRHTRVSKLSPRQVRVTDIEPRPDIDVLQLGRRHPRDLAIAERCPSQCRVVDNDGDAIARQSHVELEAVRAVGQSERERGPRVLRCNRRRPAMTDDERLGHEMKSGNLSQSGSMQKAVRQLRRKAAVNCFEFSVSSSKLKTENSKL